jgi:hypothetical protein
LRLSKQADAERDFDQCLKLAGEMKLILEERIKEMKRQVGVKQ